MSESNRTSERSDGHVIHWPKKLYRQLPPDAIPGSEHIERFAQVARVAHADEVRRIRRRLLHIKRLSERSLKRKLFMAIGCVVLLIIGACYTAYDLRAQLKAPNHLLKKAAAEHTLILGPDERGNR